MKKVLLVTQLTTQPSKKLLSIFLIFVVVILLFVDFSTINNAEKRLQISNDFIPDEIVPLCDGITFSTTEEIKNSYIEFIQINLVDKEGWYRNFYELSTDQNVLITDKYKKRFRGIIEVSYSNGTNCKFDGEMRLTGDLQDHIRNVNETSLDVQLLNGNILGITKFKLFLPETRYGINEIITTAILERMNILVPRTFQTNVIFNNSKLTEYIFQEKIAKELIENNNFREGPLIQVTEDFFWEKRNQEDNNSLLLFAEIINKYWSRRTLVNQKISFEALDSYNSLIFSSLSSNNLWINSKLTYDINDPKNYEIAKFDIALISLDAQHGMALTNRNFYYDNISDTLIPIYYDGDSQIADRVLFFESPSELCEKYADQNYYYKYLCVNDYVTLATQIKDEINFNSEDIFKLVLDKGAKVEFEVIDTAFKNFMYNLNYLTLAKNKIESYGSALEDHTSFLKNTSEYDVRFLFLNSNSNNPITCNQYLKDCKNFLIEENIFSREFLNSNEKIYPFAENLDKFIGKKNKITNDENLNNSFKVIGNPDIHIDESRKLFEVFFTDKDQKIIFFNMDSYEKWNFKFNSNFEFFEEFQRLDENSLTGCVTFYSSKLDGINISMNNLFCEDAINIIKSQGNIENISITNSSSDAVDIDFSHIEINSVFIDNAKNDCFDISSSEVIINYINTKNCGDKSLSVGEIANVKIKDLSILNAGIGIAVKDSSKVTVKDLDIGNADICLGVYRKKQEFGPAYLEIDNYTCESTEENFIQMGSVLKLKKENSK